MKKYFKTLYLLVTISVLILFAFEQSLAQNYYKFAWLSDLHIGAPKADEDLLNVVNDINNRKETDLVIVTGDIAEKGRSQELEYSQQILDQLKIPYFIIPGNHDTKWSESGCNMFKELWGDDKFAYEYRGVTHIGMNSGVPWRGGGGHIAREELPWLDSILNQIPPGNEIIFYVHHPLDGDVDNWFEATNRLREYNIKAVLVGHGHSNKLMNFNGIPSAMGRSTLSKDKNWGYTVVENKPDSLLFYEINAASPPISGVNIPKYWGGISKTEKLEIPFVDSTQFIKYQQVQVLWQKDLNTSITTSLLASNDRIFASTIDGKIFCFDLDGNEIWNYQTGGTIFSRPAISKNILIAGTIEGDLFSIDSNTGDLIQVIGLGEPVTSQLIIIDDLKSDSKSKGIILGTAKGNLYCYDITDFSMIWKNSSAKEMIETKPLFIEDRIIYGSWDNYLYSVDSETGTLNWKWTENKNFYYSPAASSPVSDGKYVYISTPDKYVSAIDLLLGTTVWRKNDFNSWETLGISEDNTKLLIKSFTDKFFIASSKDGKLIKEMNLGFKLDTMPVEPLEWKNNILFGAKNGNVYLIDNQYNWKTLFFMGSARVHSIQHVKDNIFAASNMDGRIVVFKLK